MKVVLALDFLDGKVVRLHQGNYNSVTPFQIDIESVMTEARKLGITEVHCVNLSGAKDPRHSLSSSREGLRPIVEKLLTQGFKVQVGGGIRNLESLQEVLSLGIHRAVIGTWAWNQPLDFDAALSVIDPSRITLGFDVRFHEETHSLEIATQGWTQSTSYGNSAWVGRLQTLLEKRIQRVLCTEVSRDGAMTGPHIGLYGWLLQQYGSLPIQASGGVRGPEDLAALRQLGVESVLIGKSWLLHWEKHQALPEWLAC